MHTGSLEGHKQYARSRLKELAVKVLRDAGDDWKTVNLIVNNLDADRLTIKRIVKLGKKRRRKNEAKRMAK
jgi:hypothetical protein